MTASHTLIFILIWSTHRATCIYVLVILIYAAYGVFSKCVLIHTYLPASFMPTVFRDGVGLVQAPF